MITDKQILDELRAAAGGLLYMSESDYPFVPFVWAGEVEISPDYLCEISEVVAGSQIQEVDPVHFLGGLYGKLGRVVKNHLSDLRGYQVGTINMPVYIVGRSPEGNWIGVSTRVVQT